MATFAQLRAERKAALRAVKRLQRSSDTALEKIERRIERMLKNVTYIDRESAATLVPLWSDYVKKNTLLAKGIADFILTSRF